MKLDDTVINLNNGCVLLFLLQSVSCIFTAVAIKHVNPYFLSSCALFGIKVIDKIINYFILYNVFFSRLKEFPKPINENFETRGEAAQIINTEQVELLCLFTKTSASLS